MLPPTRSCRAPAATDAAAAQRHGARIEELDAKLRRTQQAASKLLAAHADYATSAKKVSAAERKLQDHEAGRVRRAGRGLPACAGGTAATGGLGACALRLNTRPPRVARYVQGGTARGGRGVVRGVKEELRIATEYMAQAAERVAQVGRGGGAAAVPSPTRPTACMTRLVPLRQMESVCDMMLDRVTELENQGGALRWAPRRALLPTS